MVMQFAYNTIDHLVNGNEVGHSRQWYQLTCQVWGHDELFHNCADIPGLVQFQQNTSYFTQTV